MPWFDRVSRAALAALAVTVFTVAPASLGAQNTCVDSTDKEVRGLEFRGNRALSDGDLSLRVATTPSAWLKRTIRLFGGTKRCFNPAVLQRDVNGLKNYYKLRGFYDVDVKSVVEPAGPGVRVIFNITEGLPTLVTSYDVTGLSGLRDSAGIMRRLRLRVGDPWDLSLFQSDIDSIESRLRNAGHFRASVFRSFERDSVQRTAQAVVTAIPGTVARFGDSEVAVTPAPNRTQQISDETVKRLIGISPGQLFSDDAIRDAQRNLFQLGTYRQLEVQADAQQASDTIVSYTVRLTEDYMRQLDSEFGWATLDCFQTRLQYTDKNAFNTARRLELTGRATKLGYGAPFEKWPTRDLCEKKPFGAGLGIADDQFSNEVHYFLGATLRQPRLLGTRVTPALSIYSERRGEFRAYLRRTDLGGDLSATRDLGDRTPLRLGYSIEYGSTEAPDAALCALFNRCDAESRGFLTSKRPLGIASLAFSRVRTDNALSPTRGSTFRAELRSAQPWLLTSDSQAFNKATGDVAYYVPLGRNVLALRLRGGVVLGRRFEASNVTDFIPPQERLYAGGPTSVRGFQQNELGEVVYIARPRDVTMDSVQTGAGTYEFSFNARDTTNHLDSLPTPERTAPLGGNSLVVANIEFRTRLPFLFPNVFQFIAFVDGGDVWSRGGAFQMKWTPGLGMRISTPVGPVQVNVAQNVPTREGGALFFNPDVSTLACATPGNALTYTRSAGQFVQVGSAGCPSYEPPKRTGIRRLTLTFSIGSDF